MKFEVTAKLTGAGCQLACSTRLVNLNDLRPLNCLQKVLVQPSSINEIILRSRIQEDSRDAIALKRVKTDMLSDALAVDVDELPFNFYYGSAIYYKSAG